MMCGISLTYNICYLIVLYESLIYNKNCMFNFISSFQLS